MPRIRRLDGRNAHITTIQINVCGSSNLNVPINIAVSFKIAGIMNGSKKPKIRLTALSRLSRSTTSPPTVGSKVGRFTQKLNVCVRRGHNRLRSIDTKTASDKSDTK